jgi:hypothetical protein
VVDFWFVTGLRWGALREAGSTVWKGWHEGAHVATVRRRGKSWCVTLHRPGGDDELPASYTTAEGAKRSADNALLG